MDWIIQHLQCSPSDLHQLIMHVHALDDMVHILKCVNMHDELVEIARTALKMLDDPVHWSVSTPSAGGFDEEKLKELLVRETRS